MMYSKYATNTKGSVTKLLLFYRYPLPYFSIPLALSRKKLLYAPVAQLDRALVFGTKCCTFESCREYQLCNKKLAIVCVASFFAYFMIFNFFKYFFDLSSYETILIRFFYKTHSSSKCANVFTLVHFYC